jgi:hypothetical protein
VLAFATAPLGGAAGAQRSASELTQAGIEWVTTP